ncbi:TPA: DUF2384 domain-containing protein [Pseudomonas aeruginosa]|uniref:antitoxin Xre/MbcA/ParS toxin-binding domain-containing protein n=1 Tax=Pseudomonas aeruginosa TaxID=287 RepID=UPI00053D2F13|nr:antitoxin Xre/MbcA/ParS toxin-binding domain-containing protein [Pseudomonas aeruginosa]ELD5770463.1 DUF2384 domain-containing protein [Pseudomonas aeruginosa]MBG4035091.1 DUF2384 domain-containing protein [Pseudomonas aeruginosa]MBG7063747.1 DUF2384 domain-containing protein [Pseudomonas aeruginosa]MBH3964828.1 DUF2384 domain-containing protein [Pseudomonas aeruginosa]MBH4157653.1 DUF2384 domain-containing protein [Pseudomonas aeruginosa]
MLIELDLNTNDSEALLRHCLDFQPSSGDVREDARLADALEALAFAIKTSMNSRHPSDEPVEAVDPGLLQAAINLFHDKALAINWLSRPMGALGGKRPIDVRIDEALTLIARLEHGIVS